MPKTLSSRYRPRPPHRGPVFFPSFSLGLLLLTAVSACGPGRARDVLAGADQIEIALYSDSIGQVDSSQILYIRDKHSVNNFLNTLLPPHKASPLGKVIGEIHFRRVRVQVTLLEAKLYAQDSLQALLFEYQGQTYAWPLSTDTQEYLRLARSYPMFFRKTDPFDTSPF